MPNYISIEIEQRDDKTFAYSVILDGDFVGEAKPLTLAYGQKDSIEEVNEAVSRVTEGVFNEHSSL